MGSRGMSFQEPQKLSGKVVAVTSEPANALLMQCFTPSCSIVRLGSIYFQGCDCLRPRQCLLPLPFRNGANLFAEEIESERGSDKARASAKPGIFQICFGQVSGKG